MLSIALPVHYVILSSLLYSIFTNILPTEKTPGLIRTDSPGKSLDACLYMNVGSEEKPVRSRYATVDIGKLGWVISMQRWMGMYQEIYVRA